MIRHSRAFDLIIAEEMRWKEEPEVEEKEERDIINDYNTTIVKPTNVLNIRGKGHIKEITVISNRKDLKILIRLDDKIIISRTIEELIEKAEYISTIVATEYSNNYLFSLKDIKYVKMFTVDLIPADKTDVEVFYAYREAQ